MLIPFATMPTYAATEVCPTVAGRNFFLMEAKPNTIESGSEYFFDFKHLWYKDMGNNSYSWTIIIINPGGNENPYGAVETKKTSTPVIGGAYGGVLSTTLYSPTPLGEYQIRVVDPTSKYQCSQKSNKFNVKISSIEQCPVYQSPTYENEQLKALYIPPKDPNYANKQSDFFVILSKKPLNKPDTANVTPLRLGDLGQALVPAYYWQANMTNVKDGDYFVNLFYNQTGTLKDAQLCSHPDVHIKNGVVFGEGIANTPESPPPDAPCASNSLVNGKCIAVTTAIGDISTEPVGFVQTLFSLALGIAGGIAVILIIISGYRFMASRGNPEQVQAARDQLTSAIVGLLFIIFSFVILQVIGVDILKIPGFSP